MKVLWICGAVFPQVAEKLGITTAHSGGWLIGLSNGLANIDNLELTICVPTKVVNKTTVIKNGKFTHYLIPNQNPVLDNKNLDLEKKLNELKKKINPDIVHTFGSEFAFSRVALRVFGDTRTILSIQGMPSIIAKHYYANLPNRIVKRRTLLDIYTRKNIENEKKEFEKRGVIEVDIIKNLKFIIGRSDWDKACVTQINPIIEYYHCNESLREAFYAEKWDISKCERYTILMSQGNYPIKGLHIVLEAMTIIKKQFESVHLNIAGVDIGVYKSGIKKYKQSSYVKYINSMIAEYNLTQNITFLGSLDEKEMCKANLKANVHVCPSAIENSPNSLAEAMILGVPAVASFVGGIPSIISHKQEGFLYPFDAPYMLAYYISEIFKNDNLANELSERSQKRAQKTHDRKINSETLAEIYSKILRKSKNEE